MPSSRRIFISVPVNGVIPLPDPKPRPCRRPRTHASLWSGETLPLVFRPDQVFLLPGDDGAESPSPGEVPGA